MIIVEGASKGFTAIFTRIIGALFADVYLEDKQYKVIRRQGFATGLSVALSDSILTTGQAYFVRFYTVNNGLKSPDTEFFSFIPVESFLLSEDGSFLLNEDGGKIIT